MNSPSEPRLMPFSQRAADAQKGQVADIGFGYINNDADVEANNLPEAPKSPLKSAMKVPGTPARRIENPLSPTFREEQVLEKREMSTEKEQAKDLVRCFSALINHETKVCLFPN